MAVIATDPIGRIVYWNAAAEDLYGWQAREVIGRNVIDVTPTSQSQAEASHILRALRSGEPWSGTFTVRNRDGELFPVEVTDVPVFDPHGKLIGIVGISVRVS